jgi:hypothetical protein
MARHKSASGQVLSCLEYEPRRRCAPELRLGLGVPCQPRGRAPLRSACRLAGIAAATREAEHWRDARSPRRSVASYAQQTFSGRCPRGLDVAARARLLCGPFAVPFRARCGPFAVSRPTNSREHKRTRSPDVQRFRGYSPVFAAVRGSLTNRGGRIRTGDLSAPNRARYQASLRPAFQPSLLPPEAHPASTPATSPPARARESACPRIEQTIQRQPDQSHPQDPHC